MMAVGRESPFSSLHTRMLADNTQGVGTTSPSLGWTGCQGRIKFREVHSYSRCISARCM
jgi:hypothetical protein